MNLHPLKDRVLIRPDVQPTQTASGLFLAEHWKPEQTGTVIAVGEQPCQHCKALRSPEVQAGDRVVFSWQTGHEMFVNDGEPDEQRLIVMREADILAVVED